MPWLRTRSRFPSDIWSGSFRRRRSCPTWIRFPEDEGLTGAQLGIKDNATTGKFLGHSYALETVQVAEDGDIVAAAKELLGKTKLLVLKAPKADLLAIADLPEAKYAVLFNAAKADNDLRGEACRANLLHTIPSRAMLADALTQFAVWKKWTNWVVIAGPQRWRPRLRASPAEERREIPRHHRRKSKEWAFDADMRRNAAREVPLFTQDLPDHDLMVVADEADDYARYIAYHTWLPRPVAGSSGLTPVAWSRVVEQHGAAQLQSRFEKLAERPMRSIDYGAWAAVRSIGEAVTRAQSGDVATLRDYIMGERV